MEKKTDNWDRVVAEHAALGEYNEKCRLLGMMARSIEECVKKQDEAYEEFELKRKRIREDHNVTG